ncbi:MAG: hypothetical protein LBG59_02365 [Candidatus Peribacteria bacterium]|nr:hypothetical protein [Candidatus Peribacteria bacterium]
MGITKLGKKVTLTDSVFEHIIKDHGIFDPNSLIATIAKPDNTRRELQ